MSGRNQRNPLTLYLSTLLLGTLGCQTNSMMNMPWSQATRVPPPNAPSNLPTAPYTNPLAPNPMSPKPGTAPASVGASQSVSGYSANPFTDAVASAQNELRMATENARSAVERSANSVNSAVSQAGARVDRVGSGVVQATEIIESSLKDPIPQFQVPNSPASMPGAGQGDEDPNSPWRKPIPR